MRPLLGRIEAETGRRVELVRPPSYGAAVEGLIAGNVDVAELGPASYAKARSRDASILPFASTSLAGGLHTPAGSKYRSLLLVTRASGINDIAALAGRRAGLTDPNSTSGAVLPGYEFERQIGRELKHFFSALLYSGSHDRSLDALLRDSVDAAFVSSLRVDEYVRRGRIAPDDLKVLWRSTEIPHDPFVLRGRLCPELQERIRRAFLDDSAELRKAMANLGVDRMLPVTDSDYREIHAIVGRKAR